MTVCHKSLRIQTARTLRIFRSSFYLWVLPKCPILFSSWWHHQREIFSALLAICAGNSPVTGEFPAQRPVTRSFDVFFDLHLNKQLSKQWWGWWFEMPPCPLWRHCNVWGQDIGCFSWILKSAGIILCMCPAKERWCYTAMQSLIGWAHTQDDPWECAQPMRDGVVTL